ncbi:serine/threonine protein kinase [Hahella sp. CCB-MM4]|uniref:bifunctional protein-serine/threonine kinase/phosphatase n=1 Tax=Hahella sp. (strain CCB-MM4) TaxID=1926491 RepID=UPI000B9A1F4C|nr:bifunctional protein-serine/threonine kinase/phosphatase [Hahella sp. CCB-MM4]OZG71937.1 serine/threonine protein kinase [Hahella sp. CCB-MM4]
MVLGNVLSLSVDQYSTQGVKSRNEDCIGIRVPDAEMLSLKGAVALIADGVSAAENGKEAAETCVINFLNDYYSTPDSWSVKQSAQKVLVALNRWLYGQGLRALDESRGYVCTLSILVLKSTKAHIFHVGDSRIYLMRDGVLDQLTTDHTHKINAEQSYLAQAMGFSAHLEIDYRSIDLEEGDVFFLSTDGVHDFVSEQELTSSLAKLPGKFEGLTRWMVNGAMKNGSDDNLSCQIVRVDSLGLQSARDYCNELGLLPFPPPLSVGQRLDGYEVKRIIHESHRSQAYLVEDVESGERSVMKTPSVNFEDDPAYIERFRHEEWIAARVNNPHVVKLVNPSVGRSAMYYLTEYIPGVPLSRWIRDNTRPDINRVIQIVEQIVKGVRALHRKETLHQDIKPDNLLITNDDRVTLIDFGSCWIPGIQEINAPLEREHALGTACYSAPEYALGKRGSVLSEQFSVAVVAYEMLTGELPYGEAYEKAASPTAFARLKYTPAYHYNPLVPVWMDGALKKALQLDPRRRYESFSEWLHDMKRPNSRLMPEHALPLVERNPLVFWKITALTLMATQLLTLWWILHRG